MRREYKKIIIASILLILIGVIYWGCSNKGEKGENYKNFNKSNQNDKTGFDVLKDIKVGWNLGCSFDCYEVIEDNDKQISAALRKESDVTPADLLAQRRTEENTSKKIDATSGYEIMAVYAELEESAWITSDVVKFNDNGKVKLEWKIDNIKNKTTKPAKFSFQLINKSFEKLTNLSIEFNVTNAQFICKDGTVLDFKDMESNYVMMFNDCITEYIETKLTTFPDLATSEDLIGGTLIIEVSIKEYPKIDKAEKVTNNYVEGKKADNVKYYETLWGNVQTNREIIDAIKNAGFGAVRIPITYRNHMVNGVIDEAWLKRIKEVVDYVNESGMYAIINVHHDTGESGWLRADLDNIETASANLCNIWEQVGEYFKDYENKLIFEGFNEVLNSENKWSYAGNDAYKAVNILNQDFVNTIRSTGSKNLFRFLIVNTYATNTDDDILAAFKLPKDTVDNKLIAQVHCYKPNDLDYVFAQLKSTFTDKGIPLILGEFGMTAENDIQTRVNYVKTVKKLAKSSGVVCFWWDDGGNVSSSNQVYNYALLNRNNLEWYFPDIVKALTE